MDRVRLGSGALGSKPKPKQSASLPPSLVVCMPASYLSVRGLHTWRVDNRRVHRRLVPLRRLYFLTRPRPSHGSLLPLPLHLSKAAPPSLALFCTPPRVRSPPLCRSRFHHQMIMSIRCSIETIKLQKGGSLGELLGWRSMTGPSLRELLDQRGGGEGEGTTELSHGKGLRPQPAQQRRKEHHDVRNGKGNAVSKPAGGGGGQRYFIETRAGEAVDLVKAAIMSRPTPKRSPERFTDQAPRYQIDTYGSTGSPGAGDYDSPLSGRLGELLVASPGVGSPPEAVVSPPYDTRHSPLSPHTHARPPLTGRPPLPSLPLAHA